VAAAGVEENGAVESGERAELADFDPFAGEPTLMGRIGRSSGHPYWIAAAPIIAMLLLMAVELPLSGSQQAGVGSLICGDLRRILGSLPLIARCRRTDSTSFPATRDIFTFIGMLSLVVTPFTATRQWIGIRNFVSGMAGAGSLKFDTERARGALDAEVRAANASITRIADYAPLVMLICTGAMTGLILVEAHNGVFAALIPPGANARSWALGAYLHWWAGTHGDLFGLAIYFAVGSYGLYIITMQNIITNRILLALIRARRQIEFAVDPLNSDGFFGWRPVRTIATATYIELVIHGIGLAAVGITLPHGGIFTTYVFAAGQWIIILIVAVAFPPVFAWRKVSSFKRRQISDLTMAARAASASKPEYERLNIEEAYRKRIEMVRAVPVLPYKRVRDSVPFALSLIADAYAVGAILATLIREHHAH
jgi:uncharacterized membrane protein